MTFEEWWDQNLCWLSLKEFVPDYQLKYRCRLAWEAGQKNATKEAINEKENRD